MTKTIALFVAVLLLGGCATSGTEVSTPNKGVGYLLGEYRVCSAFDRIMVLGTNSNHYESVAYRCISEVDTQTQETHKIVGAIVFKTKKVGDESYAEFNELYDGYKNKLNFKELVEDKLSENKKVGYKFFQAYTTNQKR